MILSIHNLQMGHGGRTLFRDATIQFQAGNRYGVVGANGSGKSTLLRCVAGEEEPTDGSITIPKGTRVGFLVQDQFKFDEVPIIEVVMMGIPELWSAMREKEQLLAAAADGHFDAERYTALEDIVLALDGYTLEARAAEILEGLSIPAAVHRQPLSTLSGGFKLRALLARTLASSPDILLLDEPTNHLDIVSIAWLERFLTSYEGCALIVSHDHRFLDTVSTHIVDVDYERLTLYRGDYSAFERLKREERERKEADIDRRKSEIADHKAFVERFRAKPTKARQAKSRAKQLERIEITALPESSRRYPTFRFTPRRATGKVVLEVDDVAKRFGERVVLSDVTFTVLRGDRMAIIGPNGIGKSTLLKILMGEHLADRGRVEWGYEASPGYFSQNLSELEACGDQSLLEWLWAACPERPVGYVRGKLAEVLFGKDEVDKKIEALSGGELARLAFARLSILEPTVLVLDEPTNHLDLEGIEALAAALNAYEGPLLVVSHDRWFVSQIANRILELSERGVEDHRGDYEAFVRWSSSRDHLDVAEVMAAERREQRARKRKRKRS